MLVRVRLPRRSTSWRVMPNCPAADQALHPTTTEGGLSRLQRLTFRRGKDLRAVQEGWAFEALIKYSLDGPGGRPGLGTEATLHLYRRRKTGSGPRPLQVLARDRGLKLSETCQSTSCARRSDRPTLRGRVRRRAQARHADASCRPVGWGHAEARNTCRKSSPQARCSPHGSRGIDLCSRRPQWLQSGRPYPEP